MVIEPELLSDLNAEQVRELVTDLIAQVARNDQQISARNQQIDALDQQITSLEQTLCSKDREILYRQAKIEQLTHEMALLKRWKFGKSGEQLAPAQLSLLDETLDADIAAIELELERLAPTPRADTQAGQPKRLHLPPALPRVDIAHEPDSTVCTTPGCGCALKRIGQDVSEKLDYTPGVFTVERHIRGKWACAQCQSLTQAPVPAQVIGQRNSHRRAAGSGAGGQVRRPFAAVPARRHLCACWPSNTLFDAGCLGGHVRSSTSEPGRCLKAGVA